MHSMVLSVSLHAPTSVEVPLKGMLRGTVFGFSRFLKWAPRSMEKESPGVTVVLVASHV